MLHVSSFSQTHGFPAPRFQRWPRASVPPISLPDSAACHGVVDIFDPIPYALNQFSDALPVAAAKPCRSCGGYKIHHPWCPTLGLNVRTAFHPKEDGKSWTIQLAGSSPPSFGGFA